MDTLKLGHLIEGEVNRDATHIAVAPVVAGEGLMPGDHVGFMADGRVATSADKIIGIVDPFLTRRVAKGSKCWMFLYPGSITGLRHEWTHPEFKEAITIKGDKSESEKWMRAWAVEHMGSDYYVDEGKRSEEDAYQHALRAGKDNHIAQYESARDYIDNTWWNHWEILTGERGDREAYFSCSC